MSAAGAAHFGTAGLPVSFKTQGYKNSTMVPQYLAGFGLNAFEYQCGRGVRLPQKTAEVMAEKGRQGNILYSLHAPYYISMSSLDEEKRLNSVNYLLQSARAVRMLGGRRVVFHAGSCGGQPRPAVLEKARVTLRLARKALDAEGFEDIHLCPETMGKMGQLGTLEEVLALCGDDARHIPCIDFGHLNARSQGGIKTKADYAAILDALEAALGDERARCFHVHFSRIEYTAGGEKCHLTFADRRFGPDHVPLIELCAERGLAPTIICESAGTQAEDAQTMMKLYNKLKHKLDLQRGEQK